MNNDIFSNANNLKTASLFAFCAVDFPDFANTHSF